MADFLKINISSEYSPLIFKNISVTRNIQAESQQFKAKGKGVVSNYETGNVRTIIILSLLPFTIFVVKKQEVPHILSVFL
jgi:hypothetical protein